MIPNLKLFLFIGASSESSSTITSSSSSSLNESSSATNNSIQHAVLQAPADHLSNGHVADHLGNNHPDTPIPSPTDNFVKIQSITNQSFKTEPEGY